MDLDITHQLRAAGAEAVEINAPMGPERLTQLVDWLTGQEPSTVVDLGCGHGAMLLRVARRSSTTQCVGVDVDPDVIEVARAAAAAAGLGEQVTFEVADATRWNDAAAATLCIGAAHAFGGPSDMLASLAELTDPQGVGVVGTTVWSQRPDDWCLQMFGDLIRTDDLLVDAEAWGWTIEAVERSTLQEWDDFESRWTAGVTAVRTSQALSFAEQRQSDYQRYRGVLGFAWLQLRRRD
ncbi:class I SAM-dependent methyltransferase [soil metagenome]